MILVEPLISEKSMQDAAKNRYTFVVDLKASKEEVKKQVEKVFGVKVLKIQTMVFPGKKYRKGRRWVFGQKKDWKKAVLTVEAGKKIDLFEVNKA